MSTIVYIYHTLVRCCSLWVLYTLALDSPGSWLDIHFNKPKPGLYCTIYVLYTTTWHWILLYIPGLLVYCISCWPGIAPYCILNPDHTWLGLLYTPILYTSVTCIVRIHPRGVLWYTIHLLRLDLIVISHITNQCLCIIYHISEYRNGQILQVAMQNPKLCRLQ